jgi:DNA-binding cell septation regulator SpoVG
MEITDIRIRKLTLEDKMKAVISVTFDNELAVHDIKVIEGKEKLFIAMPTKNFVGRIQGYRTPHYVLHAGHAGKGHYGRI